MAPDLERISYVAWLEKDGHLDYYLEHFPEVRREAEERQATEPLRRRMREVGARIDPEWAAFIGTLGCPFRPFYFFNNHGNPRECRPEELPFAEPIGTRGNIVTFQSDFRDGRSWNAGLMQDLRALSQLELDGCFYGAATCPAHPFIGELKSGQRPLTGADVLASLRARDFRGKYIPSLEATSIPFPGDHPGHGTGVENDEIHNDFAEQHIFGHGDDDSEEEVDEFSGTHGVLKRSVADGQLWYVLLHTTPEPVDEFVFSRYVILFAVGRSRHGDRLLGVVTHQVCHNLCD